MLQVATDEFDLEAESAAIRAEYTRIQRRVTKAALEGTELPADEITAQLAALAARSAAAIEREQEHMANLKRMAAAMRPGETLGDLIEWGRARGFTTLPEVMAAREAERRE